MSTLSLIFGAITGLSLGLTGGGGAIFAVPLLVYGLGVSANDAVATSLAAVGATSLVGFLFRWRQGQVEVRTGLLFALAGMAGAPVGARIASFIPQPLLLTMFAGLMIVVAVRLWRQASSTSERLDAIGSSAEEDGPACRRDAEGSLRLTSRCALLLAAIGVVTGVLSGMFGVGGGFVIVPALVLFSGMPIHRAVGTSLMVVALISVSGVAALVWEGRALTPGVTGWFVAGGVVGLLAGQRLARRMSGPTLQRIFAVAVSLVAALIVVKSIAA